jgi:hypothetical protein
MNLSLADGRCQHRKLHIWYGPAGFFDQSSFGIGSDNLRERFLVICRMISRPLKDTNAARPEATVSGFFCGPIIEGLTLNDVNDINVKINQEENMATINCIFR